MTDTDPRGVRLLPAIGIALPVAVVVAVGLVLLDSYSREQATLAIAQDVEEELGVPVQVELGGFGTGLASLAGRIGGVELTAVEVPLVDVEPPGLHITRLDTTIVDLQVSDRVPTSGSGTFRAAFDTEEVQRAAGEGIGQAIGLEDGAVVVDLAVAEVRLDVAIEQGDLRFVPPEELGIIDRLIGDDLLVPLDVPEGVVVQEAAVEQDMLVITGTLDPVELAAQAAAD
ncbi:hypothetical protein [Euzebya tangerina]|uniref:hypothetical protein n=1 Tax=Euzebya tangerina TaxID=591198 RepID=UPI0013C34AD1|nr:hypothetical protein [Euzebya tangerina]